jgi:hypothetical protein
MKYSDKSTRIISQKFQEKEVSDFYEIRKRRIIKDFSKKVISSGIDRDWWSLVSKEDKYQICRNYNILKLNKMANVETPSIKEYIEMNSDGLVDVSKLREIKLNRILR